MVEARLTPSKYQRLTGKLLVGVCLSWPGLAWEQVSPTGWIVLVQRMLFLMTGG